MKIDKIEIENYKCFHNPTKFECGKINLYAGINGRGKSSVLQSILLVSQSFSRSGNLHSLHLNGNHINLGVYADVKNVNAPRSHELRFKFDLTEGSNLSIRCLEDESSPYRLEVVNPEEVKNVLESSPDKLPVARFFRDLHFVSADRLGPQMFLAKSDLPEFMHVGKRGEYCFEVLAQAKNGKLDIEPSKELYRGVDANSLVQQTAEWMSYVLDGAKIDFKGTESESSVLTMLISNREEPTLFKPVNIGFGYSYILPLIVAGLIAKPGEILIAENPEAHLHPRAQSRIAEFYSRVAASGVQVFLETHSEHVLNGIRLACVNPDIALSHYDVEVYFFDDDFAVKHIKLMENGRVASWPNGFFDQQEHDLTALFAMSSSVPK